MCVLLIGTHTCKHYTVFELKPGNIVVYVPSHVVHVFEDGNIDINRKAIAEAERHQGRKTNHWDNPCDKVDVKYYTLTTECDMCKKCRKEKEKQKREVMRIKWKDAEREKVERERKLKKEKEVKAEKERQAKKKAVQSHLEHERQKENNRKVHQSHHNNRHDSHHNRHRNGNNGGRLKGEQNVGEIRRELKRDDKGLNKGLKGESRQQGTRRDHHHNDDKHHRRGVADKGIMVKDVIDFANKGRNPGRSRNGSSHSLSRQIRDWNKNVKVFEELRFK